MATVDTKIVEMRFDNAEFERRISTTMQSIANLDKSISQLGSKEGITDLAKQIGSFSMEGMSSAIEGVSNKFLALASIGITALANLTNRAIDAGIQIAKSLAFDQISSGFQEYELKLGSIQTIMAGSGESLDVVNQKLAELNAYSDKTIYSFKDMTSNIGKFTNAGVDLDTSVAAIQGVANVAAVSGANAEEASRAMYNFAQALSKGSVQLIDWKSIELANMGTVEFKQQLLDTAVATGELTKKGDQYITKAGTATTATKGFNESLTDQWLTTDVLTTTLGDYADETTEIGKKAFAAAQDIKTFSQLMDTTKEAIGSGWAQSFEILFGNFEEAKQLWGDVGNAIGKFVGQNADARNKLLQDWKDLGGRTVLIDGIKTAFVNLGAIIAPIKEAFRDIFPAMTGQRLMDLTNAFHSFAESLAPSEQTIENVKRIFTGLFNVLDVGWELLKKGVGFIADLIQELTGLGGGGALSGLAAVGDALAKLTPENVIAAFKTAFDKIVEFIKSPLPVIQELWDKISEFWGNLTGLSGDAASGAVDQVKGRFDALKEAGQKIAEIVQPIQDAFTRVKEIFSDAWDAIKNFFSDLGQTISDASDEGDYSKMADALTIGLLGGILAGIVKFMKSGIKIDIGGGFIDSIKESLKSLTGVLEGMQAKLKAEALEKIAIAIGILTASIVVLSMIDADALAKAMTAIAVGFGQLMGAFAVLQKMTVDTKTAFQFGMLAIGLTLLAGAALLLGVAAKLISTMDWNELARGMLGLTAILGIMVGVTKLLQGQTGTLIQAGAGMIAVGIGIGIMALSMKIFASMDWEEMGKGFAGLVGSLLAVAAAMKLMPSDMGAKTAGIMGLAAAMLILSFAMKAFAQMDWVSMGKGLVGVGAGLSAMAIGLKLMPSNLGTSALSIMIVSAAMIVLAIALRKFSELSFGDIAKGVLAIVATLTVIAVAMKALEGSLAGGVGLLVLTYALGNLAKVLETFAALSISTIVSGLLAMVGVLAALAGVAYLIQPAIPAMLLLGVALALVGAGIALLGLGVSLVVGAFVTLTAAGQDVKKSIIDMMEGIGAALPALMTGFAKGLLAMGETLIGGIPMLVEIIGELISALLVKLTELLPEAEAFLIELIDSICGVLEESIPRIAEMGLKVLLGLLQGIEENIGQIVTTVTNIITNFLNALSEQIPGMKDAVVGFIITLFTNVASAVGELSTSLWIDMGVAMIDGMWKGLNDSFHKILDLFSNIIGQIIDWVKSLFGISSPSSVFADIGNWLMEGLLKGLVDGFVAVWNWFVNLGTTILSAIGDFLVLLATKGRNLLSGLLSGITSAWWEVYNWFTGLGGKVLSAIGDVLETLLTKGRQLLAGLWDGIKEKWVDVKDWFTDLPDKVKGLLFGAINWLVSLGKDIFQGLWNGLKNKWNEVSTWIGEKMNEAKHLITHPWDILSPSRVAMGFGDMIMTGFLYGMQNSWDDVSKWLNTLDPSEAINVNQMQNSLMALAEDISGLEEFNPTITPVLDLSNVMSGVKTIDTLIGGSSYANAALIASSPSGVGTDTAIAGAAGGVTFIQNNQSPEMLSTAEIYKQTRNQITLAKEELSIP